MGAPGNCSDRCVGALLGSFLMKRLAFSEVTKSSSESGSLPNFSVIKVNCRERGQKMREAL